MRNQEAITPMVMIKPVAADGAIRLYWKASDNLAAAIAVTPRI